MYTYESLSAALTELVLATDLDIDQVQERFMSEFAGKAPMSLLKDVYMDTMFELAELN